MKKSTCKKLTHWLLTAVFLVLVAGFSLLDQPSARAQGFFGTVALVRTEPSRPALASRRIQTPPASISEPENVEDLPSVREQPSPAPTLSPTAPVSSSVTAPVESVAANVRRLLETNQCVGCDLSGAVLKDMNLQAANLEGANLQKADLERANLQTTNLQGANLRGADLGKANIAAANLRGANLFDADLEKANLQAANL